MKNGTPHTKPEVFILESLTLDDEGKDQKDGLMLSQALHLYNKKPKYFYFRTERELINLIALFKESNYRYLHLSCHGSAASLSTTFDELDYGSVGRILGGTLNNKRLFVSACEAGNDLFSAAICGSNPGVYSVLAPSTAIHFNRSAAFWSAFYFLMFDFDSTSMKRKTLRNRLLATVTLFDVQLHFTWNSAHEGRFKSELLVPDITKWPVSDNAMTKTCV
ncbi:MAG: hypothetical protein M5R41_06810 [Bacteroidia bacterium]|nr:hypothetical protein [Bacteroidia bacterium]